MKLLIPALSLFLATGAVSMADETAPVTTTKAAIAASTQTLLSSEKAPEFKSSKAKVKWLFNHLVKQYGVDNRLLIGEAVAAVIPDEDRSLVAKQVLYYSPVDAQKVRSLFERGDSNVSNAVASVLPSQSVFTSVGELPGRQFVLPQVDERRRVASVDENGRVVGVSGSSEAGEGAVTATLGPVEENGFTLDGLGYSLVDSEGEFIGVYMSVEDAGEGEYIFSQKALSPGNPAGSGGATVTIQE